MLRLSNPIRRYDWGSTSAIPDLLGVPPDGDPQAELWIGAHPDSPSILPDGRRLDDVVRADPVGLLGPAVHGAFGDRLPYLAKILAAAVNLSLQVHPDADQAAAGFAEEEARGIPRDARERRYKDPFHKPEMVIALERFEALCGWRDPQQTRPLIAALAVDHPLWGQFDGMLVGETAEALQGAVAWLLDGQPDLDGLVAAVGEAAARHSDTPELRTIADLASRHPGDPGVVVALLLNRVTLARGEALHLTAGNVHAYLRGTAVEVMAASDNVLRAGLTSKHVDPAELLRTVDWTPGPVPYVSPTVEGIWRHYHPGAAEFQIDWADLDIETSEVWHEGPSTGPRVVLALEAPVEVRDTTGSLQLSRGQAVLVSDDDGSLHLRGAGSAVVVAVPPEAL